MTVRVPMFEKALTRMLFRSPRSTAPSQTDTCGAQRRRIHAKCRLWIRTA